MTYDDVRALALKLPAVEEGTSYGTAALKVKGKLFVRPKEDGETIVVRTDELERLNAVRKPMLQDLIDGAWQRTAPKSLRK
jgi:hypothetical protein